MARLARKTPNTDYIPVDRIRVDPAYQRDIKPTWVSYLAESWDDRAVGLICVSERIDGYFYVLDGHHRVEAARRLDIEFIPAEVWLRLTPSEEAEMFLQRNNDLNVRRVDKFLAAVTAGRSDQCEIIKIVEDAGWVISDSDNDGQIRAVAALERIYGASTDLDKQRRPEALRTTLEVVRRAWGFDQDGVAGFLLDGLGRFLIRYWEQVDIDRLIRKLSKYEGGPTALVGRSKELRAFIRTTVPNCVAEMLVETYNVGLRTNKLPGWRS